MNSSFVETKFISILTVSWGYSRKKTKHGREVGWGYGISRCIKEIAHVWNFQGLIKWNLQGWPRKNNDVEFPGAGLLIFGLGISLIDPMHNFVEFPGGGALSSLEFRWVR